MIGIQGLRVVFGRTVALDGIDLELRPGLTGLFGPNGSGKSTLLRVLGGLLRPTNGVVLLDARPLRFEREEVRRRIGYGGHQSGLYPALTVEENVALFARLYGATAGRVEYLLDRLDIAPWRSTPVGELSAGLARRATVARALVHDPDVLLLDEPYANLDDDAAARVSEALIDWWRPNKLALIATHGAKKLKAFAHAGVILKRGRVVVSGSYAMRERATR